jgi:uncharacterized membrane protein
MLAIMWLAAILAGVVHVVIFCMESLWWSTRTVRARFRQSPEQAEATRLFAFNQGFYNLVLTGHPRVEGDFSLPGFVHDREVPGTAVMTARRAAIT